MIGCKVAKRATVMDRLQRTQIKRATKIGAIRSLPEAKRVESVDLTKTNQDVVLHLSLFFALNSLWRSVHDFPHCPSQEAWSQQEPPLHPALTKLLSRRRK